MRLIGKHFPFLIVLIQVRRENWTHAVEIDFAALANREEFNNIDIMRDIHAAKSHSVVSVCTDSSLTICYLEKRQELTRDDLEARRWLPSPHCPELSRTSDARGRTISPLSLSLFISLPLKVDKAFLC